MRPTPLPLPPHPRSAQWAPTLQPHSLAVAANSASRGGRWGSRAGETVKREKRRASMMLGSAPLAGSNEGGGMGEGSVPGSVTMETKDGFWAINGKSSSHSKLPPAGGTKGRKGVKMGRDGPTALLRITLTPPHWSEWLCPWPNSQHLPYAMHP